MDLLRSGIVLDEFFEESASGGKIVVAAGLSFVIANVFVVGVGFGSSVTLLAFDTSSSRKFCGGVILATVESVATFLACLG